MSMIPGGSRWETERENVGPGWRPILERLHEDLLKIQPGYEVLQIKEKFGGLRYYVAGGENFHTGRNKEFWDRIQAAEEEAARTCEDCGTSDPSVDLGPLGEDVGWWLTLCPPCRATRYQRAVTQRILREATLDGE